MIREFWRDEEEINCEAAEDRGGEEGSYTFFQKGESPIFAARRTRHLNFLARPDTFPDQKKLSVL